MSDLLSRVRPDPRYRVRICLLSKTGRLLYFIEDDRESMDFNKMINGVNYQIRKEGAYQYSPWLYKQAYWRLKNKKEYWILFNEGEPEPVSPSNPKVSPYELYLINNSTAMQKGISDYLRSSPLSGKGGFIAIVAVLIIVYIVMQYTGVKIL